MNHYRLNALLAFVALFLVGCAVNLVKPFNESDFAPYEKEGSSTAQGHAFLRLSNGMLRNAGGLPIYLVPLTPYTDELGNIMAQNKSPASSDPRLAKYTRTTTGDIGGHFSFDHLPAGGYLVFCSLSWQPINRNVAGGGTYFLVSKFQLAEGESKHVVVSRGD